MHGIFDGAASLNDCLNPGPRLQNNIWKVLVRGRFNPAAVTGGIEKAFLLVRIKESDQDALRFHWRYDKNSALETLRFTRALFGLTSSPFLLGESWILIQNFHTTFSNAVRLVEQGYSARVNGRNGRGTINKVSQSETK